MLIAGWLVALPVPFLIIAAPNWGWVVFANVLLGVNQGLCWSTTVIMKIDLVGPARRGLAMGLNEAAGYGAVSLAAASLGLSRGHLWPATSGLLPGIGFALAGLLLSVLFVRESHGHRAARGAASCRRTAASRGRIPWRHGMLTRRLRSGGLPAHQLEATATLSGCQPGRAGQQLERRHGLGPLPALLRRGGPRLAQIGAAGRRLSRGLGVAQLGTGALSDRVGRKG